MGILLITPAVALTGLGLGALFDKPLESVDRSFVSNGFVESPRRLNQPRPAADFQPALAVTNRTPPRLSPPVHSREPLASQGSVDPTTIHLDSAPFPPISFQSDFNQANPIQANPIQANRLQSSLVDSHADYETSERAEPIPEIQLADLDDDSDDFLLETSSRVSPRQVLNASVDSIPDVQQESESVLEAHFSTARSKHIKNRYVKPDLQPTLADRVFALEQGSLTRGPAEAIQDELSQDSPAVQRTNYESKIAGPTTSVLISEPSLSGPGNVSVLDTTPRLRQSEIVIDSEAQQSGLPRKIAPTSRGVGMPMQQLAPSRLQVNPQVEARAREHIEYGESLARRKSYLAAREEFTLAVLLIARSHKSQSDPDAYSNRLALGLAALDEASDFVGPNHHGSQHDVLQQKVLSHKTKLISPNEIGNISRTKALDRYCGFAQSQIEQAIGYSAAGSAALHTLGKIETRASVNNRQGDWTGQARALVFFRAAMSCDPANAACANDLGVLLHDMGRLAEAEQVLKVSIASSPTRSAWANLASVHSQLAVNAKVVDERDRQLQLAKRAAMGAERFSYGVTGNGSVGGQWASLNEFHSNAAFPSVMTQRAPQTGQQTSNPRDASTAKSLLQKVKGWY